MSTPLSYCLISRALTREDSFNALVEQMRGQDQFVLTPCVCVPACAQITREQVAELDRRVAVHIKNTIPICVVAPKPKCSGCGGVPKYYGPGFGYAGQCEACLVVGRERRKKVRFIVSPV